MIKWLYEHLGICLHIWKYGEKYEEQWVRTWNAQFPNLRTSQNYTACFCDKTCSICGKIKKVELK